MGRPKGAKNVSTETNPKHPEPAQAISKAAAVRQALAEGIDGLDDIAAYVKAKHGHEIPKPQISAYKAQTKAKAAGVAPKAVPEKKPKALVQQVAKHGGGGETDLIVAMEMLKPMVKEHGVERIKKIVDLLE
jgi:hypothetical protein